jgi:hypothetical protein
VILRASVPRPGSGATPTERQRAPSQAARCKSWRQPLTFFRLVLTAFSAALPASCASPVHWSGAQTISTPRAPSLDVTALARDPVAVLGLGASPALQGFGIPVSHALTTALSQASPPIRGIPAYEVLNQLNEKGLAADYTAMVSEFPRSGILDRERLRRIGSALGVRFVLQPGLAEVGQTLLDRFEMAGFKLVRVRVQTLRLWLQLWDTETGQMLWESGGEATVTTELLIREQSTVSLNDIAENLWSRMIQNDLLGGGTRSRIFFSF